MKIIRPKKYLGDTDGSPMSQENRIAYRTGGKRVNGSGASDYSKGDVRGVHGLDGVEFLVECKQTKHASISIKWGWLRKITDEAQAAQCEPALCIEIKGGEDDPRVDRDWIAIPLRVFEKINDVNNLI